MKFSTNLTLKESRLPLPGNYSQNTNKHFSSIWDQLNIFLTFFQIECSRLLFFMKSSAGQKDQTLINHIKCKAKSPLQHKNVSIPFDVSSDSECLLELPESRFCQWWDDSRGNVHQPSHLIRNLVVGARSDVTNHFLKWETSLSIPKVAVSWMFGNFEHIVNFTNKAITE